MSNNRLGTKERKVCFVLLFIVSVVMLGICSVTTSPLFKDCYKEFNNNFSVSAQLIGKAFLEGKIPYKDLCGTEGILYYLIQALGYLIGGRTGVFVLQAISLFISLCIIYKMTRKLLGIKLSIGVMALVVYVSIATIGSGNSSMEFSLPFISASVFILMHMALENGESNADEKAIQKISFLTGVMMAVLLFLTFHNVVIVLLLTISFFYLLDRKNRAKSIGAFFAGVGLISIPILVILWATGAISYYFYDGVLLQLEEMKVGNGTVNEMVRKVLKNIPLALIFLVALLNKDEHLGKLKKVIAGISGMLFLALLTGLGYWHYYICMIPFLGFGFLKACKSDNKIFKILQNVLLACITVVLYLTPIKNNMTTIVNECFSHEYEYNNLASTQWYEDFITEDDSVIAVDVSPAFYLVNDYIPDYRLFANQTWLTRIVERYRTEIQDEVFANKHTYLLIGGSGMVSEAYGDYELSQMINLYRTTYQYQLNTETE